MMAVDCTTFLLPSSLSIECGAAVTIAARTGRTSRSTPGQERDQLIQENTSESPAREVEKVAPCRTGTSFRHLSSSHSLFVVFWIFSFFSQEKEDGVDGWMDG